jgi:hypothetical protein
METVAWRHLQEKCSGVGASSRLDGRFGRRLEVLAPGVERYSEAKYLGSVGWVD